MSIIHSKLEEVDEEHIRKAAQQTVYILASQHKSVVVSSLLGSALPFDRSCPALPRWPGARAPQQLALKLADNLLAPYAQKSDPAGISFGRSRLSAAACRRSCLARGSLGLEALAAAVAAASKAVPRGAQRGWDARRCFTGQPTYPKAAEIFSSSSSRNCRPVCAVAGGLAKRGG